MVARVVSHSVAPSLENENACLLSTSSFHAEQPIDVTVEERESVKIILKRRSVWRRGGDEVFVCLAFEG